NSSPDFDLNKWDLRLSRETIVKSPSPPTPEWGKAYCIWVTGFRSDDVVMESSTTTTVLQLQFLIREYSPLIKRSHEFLINFRRVEYWQVCQGEKYWEETSQLFDEIKEAISQPADKESTEFVI